MSVGSSLTAFQKRRRLRRTYQLDRSSANRSRARVAAESLVPGASVTDVARQHGTTRWQVYDWRKRLRTGQLIVPERVAALPMSIWPQAMSYLRPSSAMLLVNPVTACLVEV